MFIFDFVLLGLGLIGLLAGRLLLRKYIRESRLDAAHAVMYATTGLLVLSLLVFVPKYSPVPIEEKWIGLAGCLYLFLLQLQIAEPIRRDLSASLRERIKQHEDERTRVPF